MKLTNWLNNIIYLDYGNQESPLKNIKKIKLANLNLHNTA